MFIDYSEGKDSKSLHSMVVPLLEMSIICRWRQVYLGTVPILQMKVYVRKTPKSLLKIPQGCKKMPLCSISDSFRFVL